MKILSKNIFIFFLFFFNLFSQPKNDDIEFFHFSDEHLPTNSSVYCLIEDDLGFIWVGTEEGLYRFDGYSVELFTVNPEVKNSLANKNISDMVIYDSKLWLATWGGGLNVFDSKTKKFKYYQHNKNDKNSIGSDKVQCIFIDNENTLWVGTNGGGLSRYNPKTDNFTNYKNDPTNENSISFNRVWRIAQSKDGLIWIATNRGINSLNKSNNKITRFILDKNDTLYQGANFVREIFISKDGTIWAGTQKGLFYKRTDDDKFHHYIMKDEIKELNINRINETDQEDLLIGSRNSGLFYLNLRENKLTQFVYDVYNDRSISSNDIRVIYKDKSNTYWIGTREGGLCLTRFNKLRFIFMNKNLNSPYSLSGNNIRSLFLSGNNLYLGTNDDGLDLYDLSKDSISVLIQKKSLSDPNRRISAVYEDKNGNLWIVTHSELKVRKTGRTDFQSVKLNNPEVFTSLNYVRHITSDKNGNLWLGFTNIGLVRYSPNTGELIKFSTDTEKGTGPSSEDVNYFAWESDSVLWMATNNGLNRLNINTMTFKVFGIQPRYANILTKKEINSIIINKNKIIWIGTVNGLMGYDIKADTFLNYTYLDNYNLGNINALSEDNNGRIWLGSNKGIIIFNPDTKHYRTYTTQDGFPNNRYNAGACVKTKSGIIFMGGTNGLIKLFPDRFNKALPIRNTHITKISYILDDKIKTVYELNSLTPEKSRTIDLNSSENNLIFSFVGINFFSPQKTKYKYMLEGFDKGWIDANGYREAKYTNVPPGNYTFKVISANSDGEFNYNEAKISIHIATPFYKSWIFILFVALLITVLVVVTIKIRTYSLEKAKIKLQELVDHQTKELRESEQLLREMNATKDKFFSIISHDLKSPFTALIGFSNLLKEDYDTLSEEDRKYYINNLAEAIKNLYDLLDNLLTWSRLNLKKVSFNPADVNLYKIIQKAINSQKVNADNKNISLYNECPIELSAFCDSDLIEVTIRNLLSNAIKFTINGGSVKVNAYDKDNFIFIEVEDNGIGMSPEIADKLFQEGNFFTSRGTANEKGTGLGFSICREFIEMHKGSISVKSEPGVGTKITIKLPKQV